MKQKTLFVGAVAVLVVGFLVGTLVYKSEKVDESAQLVERNRAHLVQMYSPTIGRADAPVEIVEFLDPACDTCKEFYPFVKGIIAANPDRIRLVLRYAPFHNGSDKVVAILEAARKQGKFWPTLEALFAAQSDWAPNHTAQVDRVWKHLDGLGLNIEQLRVAMNAPEIPQVIAQDLEDARVLEVTQTPGFFVNGKPLQNFGYEPLKAMVDEALAAGGRY